MVALYLGVAAVGYAYRGQSAPPNFINCIDQSRGWHLGVTLMLFLHVMFVYVIKSVVLARFLLLNLAGPQRLDERSARARWQCVGSPRHPQTTDHRPQTMDPPVAFACRVVER